MFKNRKLPMSLFSNSLGPMMQPVTCPDLVDTLSTHKFSQEEIIKEFAHLKRHLDTHYTRHLPPPPPKRPCPPVGAPPPPTVGGYVPREEHQNDPLLSKYPPEVVDRFLDLYPGIQLLITAKLYDLKRNQLMQQLAKAMKIVQDSEKMDVN